MISPEQIKAARQQLCWTRTRLAEKARVGRESVRRAERVDGEMHVQPVTFAKIRRALEIAGIDFAGPQPTIKFQSLEPTGAELAKGVVPGLG